MLPSPGPDAGRAVTILYDRHYRSLVRLAALLVQDIDAAEALVQDSFVAMHSAGDDSPTPTGRWLTCIRRS